MKVPIRIASAIMNSLKGGVVPRTGLAYITVGREKEIQAMLHDIQIIEQGGAAFRFIVGKYGSGKSFLLQTIRNYAMDRDFVVVDADLSPQRRLMGTNNQGLATYQELIQNMSTKTKPEGGALSLILQKWLLQEQTTVMKKYDTTSDDPGFYRLVEIQIFERIQELEANVHGFEFAKVLSLYYKATMEGDDLMKSQVLKWLRGEYSTKTESKKDLGIHSIITDSDWYEYIKLFALFMVKAGYKGLIVLLDELVNVMKIPHSVTRQYNYEKLLALYNDTMQGKAKHLGIFMGGTPQSIEDTRRGVYSYEALRSRLESSRFASDDVRDLLAPIIRLTALTHEEMFVLMEKLAHIHSDLNRYPMRLQEDELIAFIRLEYDRIGASNLITPREIIRDFIELLNILYQYPEKSMQNILDANELTFASAEEEVEDAFVGFEL